MRCDLKYQQKLKIQVRDMLLENQAIAESNSRKASMEMTMTTRERLEIERLEHELKEAKVKIEADKQVN